MKILLVHADGFKWATQVRAEAFKKRWTNDEVDIVYRDNLPSGDKYDVIHFLYSGGVGREKDYILRYKNKTFTTLASQRTLDEYYDKLPVLIEIYKNTVCCVCQNPTFRRKLKKIIKQNNVVYIPNGVDEKLFKRKFVVGFVGSKQGKNDHKGFKLAKEACEELDLDFKFLHLGEESELQPIKLMPKFYRKIDCLVIPSASEGCNNPTLEALAMNKPVISTRVGIAEELEGVTLVNRDVESIKNALRKLSGRIQILEKYTWDKIAKKYHDLYIEKAQH